MMDVCSRQCLSKLAFKRVRRARGTFRTLSEKVPVQKRKRLEKKFTEQGLFDFSSQTAQVRSPFESASSFSSLIPSLNPVWEFIPLSQSSPLLVILLGLT